MMKSENFTNTYKHTSTYLDRAEMYAALESFIKTTKFFKCDDYTLCYHLDNDKKNNQQIVIENIECHKKKDILLKIPEEIDGIPVKTINADAFKGCVELKSVEFGKNIEFIQREAFSGCLNLNDVIFNEGLKFIGSSAFSYTKLEGTVKFPDSLRRISSNAFSYSGIKDINLNSTLTEIGSNAFCHCDNIQKFTIPDSVKQIDFCILGYCNSLKSIFVGKDTSLNCNPALGCEKLSSYIVHPENKRHKSINGILYDYNVKSLLIYPCGKEDKVFYIPRSVSYIENNAFALNTPLNAVHVKQDSITGFFTSGLLSGKIKIYCRSNTDIQKLCNKYKVPTGSEESKIDTFLKNNCEYNSHTK